MGFLSDDDYDIENAPIVSPPASPRLAPERSDHAPRGFLSDSLDFNTDIAQELAFACCEEFELTDADREDVVRMSQMHHQYIAIRQYALTRSLAREVHRMIGDSFLNSAEFKDHITRRIQATLLDPFIPTYVRGMTARLVKHTQLNPASWHIPPVVQTNFLHTKAWFKAVGQVASNFRGEMHRKLKKSIVEKSDAVTLANRLAIKGYQPDRDHIRQVALLRAYMKDWQSRPCSAGKGRGLSYFSFIDLKLDKLRSICAGDTEASTLRNIKAKLAAALIEDQKQYPGSNTTVSSGKNTLSAWQKDTRTMVREMASYVIEPARDEDEADDEGEPPSANNRNSTPTRRPSRLATPAADGSDGRPSDEHEEEEPDPPTPTAIGESGDTMEQSPRSPSTSHGRVLVEGTQTAATQSQFNQVHSQESSGTIIPSTQQHSSTSSNATPSITPAASSSRNAQSSQAPLQDSDGTSSTATQVGRVERNGEWVAGHAPPAKSSPPRRKLISSSSHIDGFRSTRPSATQVALGLNTERPQWHGGVG